LSAARSTIGAFESFYLCLSDDHWYCLQKFLFAFFHVSPASYSLASPICGAARHAGLPSSSSFNVTIVNVTAAFFFCRASQNQVQTAGSGAPSLVAPGLAFSFAALEPAVARAASTLTAALSSAAVLNATCQQTFSELLRGRTPALGATIRITCPKCTHAFMS
jgi:hypothetical protein